MMRPFSSSYKRLVSATCVPPNKRIWRVDWKQVVGQWTVGVLVTTPIIAILQGIHKLNDYRVHHGDAPRPVMPSRGVAIAVTKEDEQELKRGPGGFFPILSTTTKTAKAKDQSQPTTSHGLNHPSQRPLRILVVGDSLAAGVGISKSGTPVLPESIARELSMAFGGRVVYWTCLGTPGVSAAQIVQDIHRMEPHTPGRLESLLKEWQAKRRRWLLRQELKRRRTEIDEDNPAVDQESSNVLRKWWKQVSSSNTKKTPREIGTTTKNVFREWWDQLTTRVKEDIHDIREIVQSEVAEFELEDYDADMENLREDKDQPPLILRGNLFRRDSLDPRVAAQYDITIVLTGLNDLKDTFMPFMMMGPNSSIEEGTKRLVGGLKSQLRRVLDALKQKMGVDLEVEESRGSSDNSNNRTVSSSSSKRLPSEASPQQNQPSASLILTATTKRPLIVVPALPVAPLVLFKTAPIKWFLLPLFTAMEANKRALSEVFPELVLFVPQPSNKAWRDIEAGLGPINEGLDKERLLFRLTDATYQAKERIKQLMKQHYQKWVDDQHQEESNQRQSPSDQEHETREQQEPQDSRKMLSTTRYSRASRLIAADNMHPNDAGYEAWGRHIAGAIVQHWKQ